MYDGDPQPICWIRRYSLSRVDAFCERPIPELVKLLGGPAFLPGKTALIDVHGKIKQVGSA
jgi:hypothetical protein